MAIAVAAICQPARRRIDANLPRDKHQVAEYRDLGVRCVRGRKAANVNGRWIHVLHSTRCASPSALLRQAWFLGEKARAKVANTESFGRPIVGILRARLAVGLCP